MKKLFIRSLVLVFLTVLSGCDSSSDTTIVNSPPNTVTITSSNFEAIIAAVVGQPLLHFNVLEFLFSDPDLPSNGACPDGGQATIQIIDSDPPGGSMNDSVKRSYNECAFPNQTFDGTVEIFFAEASGDIRIDTDTGRITFIGTSSGEFDLEVDDFDFTNLLPLRNLQVDRDTTRTLVQTIDQVDGINEVIDSSKGNRFAFSLDGVDTEFNIFELLLDVDNVSQRYSLISSKAKTTKSFKLTNSQIEGTVSVTFPSDTPLRGGFSAGTPREFSPPDAGQFIVEGNNNTKMLVTVDGSTVPVIIDVKIDTTGDGDFDIFNTLTWLEIGLDLDVSFLR